MAAIKTLANLQKMKRSVKLRDGSLSDDELVEIMEQMINQAIVAQATGNERMMKRSLQELRQVRKDVRTGNVDMSSGSRQTQMIGRFSNLIDQLEGEQQATREEVKQMSGGGIMSNLPSAETFISAVMTSNPLLGYSAKILKDIGGTVTQKKQVDKEAAKRQAKILEEQKDYILGRQEELAVESDINQEKKNQITEYDAILQRIESELIRLRQVWEGDDTQLVQESQNTNNKLSKLVEAEERIIEEQRLQREQDEFDDIEAQRTQDSGSGLMGDTNTEQEGDGLLGMLGGLAAGLSGGIMTGVMGVFGILKSIGTVGLSLLKIGLKGSVIGAVIMSIYNFIDGFFKAGDILDMDEADLNIGDRIIAGFANVWGSIIKLFDTVLEWFGIDLFDSEDIEKTIAKKTKSMVDTFFNWVFGLFDNVQQFIQDFDIGETLTMIKEKSIEFMQNLVDIIPNMVTDAFEQVGDLFGDAKNWLFGDDEDAVSDEDKKRLDDLRRGKAVSFDGKTSSSTMPDSMSNLEESSYRNASQGAGAAVVAGNNNTNVYHNKTEVTTAGNVTNPDESFRRNNAGNLDRLRNS